MESDDPGMLTKKESQSIVKAFIKKSGISLDVDTAFHYLDANNDEHLDQVEVESAIRAMWLMSTNKVKLKELLQNDSCMVE